MTLCCTYPLLGRGPYTRLRTPWARIKPVPTTQASNNKKCSPSFSLSSNHLFLLLSLPSFCLIHQPQVECDLFRTLTFAPSSSSFSSSSSSSLLLLLRPASGKSYFSERFFFGLPSLLLVASEARKTILVGSYLFPSLLFLSSSRSEVGFGSGLVLVRTCVQTVWLCWSQSAWETGRRKKHTKKTSPTNEPMNKANEKDDNNNKGNPLPPFSSPLWGCKKQQEPVPNQYWQLQRYLWGTIEVLWGKIVALISITSGPYLNVFPCHGADRYLDASATLVGYVID